MSDIMNIQNWLDNHAENYAKIADQIWEFAEPRFEEVKSAKLQINTLKNEHFSIQQGVAGMPTAFIGSFGQGHPVIAILGEYDALSGLSQKSGVFEKIPLEEGKCGHGCGHNLLGVGSMAAAIAVKHQMEEKKIAGTIRYYGCPAEEGGSGKTYMVRERFFDDVDIALTWHPFSMNFMFSVPTLANIQAYFRFTGRSAHAAAAPHQGRSALDAVELMNVGVNYLREHIIPEARVHYAVTNTGGNAPNVVQANAEVLYLMRAPTILLVNEIYERVQKVAKGAALMTGTKVETVFDKAASDFIPNDVVGNILFKNFQAVGGPKFSGEETEYATEIQKTIHDPAAEANLFAGLMKKMDPNLLKKMTSVPLASFILPNIIPKIVAPGSTDVGDVSWIVPTNQIGTACMAMGTPAHSWQEVAQTSTSIGHKGMMIAAKVLALAAVEFLSNPDLCIQANKELDEKLGDKGYRSPIASNIQPNIPDWVKKAMEN